MFAPPPNIFIRGATAPPPQDRRLCSSGSKPVRWGIVLLGSCPDTTAVACIVALLWKLPQMPSCNANNTNLDRNKFDMFYKIDCCAAIHGQIWMNNVPNESRIIMLPCTEINFVRSFFDFEQFGVKPGFPFFSFNSTGYRESYLTWLLRGGFTWRSDHCIKGPLTCKCLMTSVDVYESLHHKIITC